MKWCGTLRMAAAAFVVMAVLGSASCGGGMARRTADLLDRNYVAMDHAELQVYYQQLSDQLAAAARAARGGQGRGLLEINKAGDQATQEALRERWNAVRQELRQRESIP